MPTHLRSVRTMKTQHTSAYVSTRQHTLKMLTHLRSVRTMKTQPILSHACQHPSASVSIRQHPSAYSTLRSVSAMKTQTADIVARLLGSTCPFVPVKQVN